MRVCKQTAPVGHTSSSMDITEIQPHGSLSIQSAIIMVTNEMIQMEIILKYVSDRGQLLLISCKLLKSLQWYPIICINQT